MTKYKLTIKLRDFSTNQSTAEEEVEKEGGKALKEPSSDIKGTDQANQNFHQYKMDQMNLSATNFCCADLSSSSLVQTDLTKATLRGANLMKSTLTKAKLTKADLTKANLTKTWLVGADLSGADLTGANLTDANLEEANLEDADLTDAILTNANLTKANLNNTKLNSSTQMWGTCLSDTQLSAQNSISEKEITFEYSPASEYNSQNDWKNTRKVSTAVTFANNDASDTSVKTADLVSIKYQKEMYTQNWIDFTLMFQNKSGDVDAWLKNLLMNFRMAKVNLFIQADDADVYDEIATDYFIFDIETDFQSDSSAIAYVHFRTYSPDKLLSLHPYSRAYTGKKFFNDIVNTELPKLQGNFIKWKEKYQSNFQVLKLTNSTEKNPDDFIQPYLVQYNEDFYSFIARTLNRCGEFLYYENGILHFGCPNAFQKDAVVDVNIKKYISYKKKCYANVYNAETFFGGSTNYDSFHSDYSQKATNEEDLNEDQKKIPAHDVWVYQNDGSHAFVRNSELGANEFCCNYEKGSCTKLGDFRPLALTLLNGFKGALEKRTLMDMIYYLLDYSVTQTISAEEGSLLKNKQVDDKYFKPAGKSDEWDDSAKETWKRVENNSSYNLRLKETKDDKGNQKKTISLYTNQDNSCACIKDETGCVVMFSPDFYHLIRVGIEQTERERIRIRLGAYQKGLCLGSIIQFKGESFLVVKIESNCFSRLLEENDSEELMKRMSARSALFSKDYPSDSNETDTHGFRDYAYRENSAFRHVTEDCIIEAIPWKPSTYTYPTDCHRPPFINPGPQRAFIADNMDPLRMNRVRIRYNWQPKNDLPSPWIRLSTPMATAKGGINMLPNVGDEAIINFEYGNMERPFVEGMVYNKARPPKFSHLFNASRSITSANGHSIQFDDNPLSLQAWLASFMPAIGAFTSLFPVRIKGNSKLQAGGISLKDSWGMYNIMMSADKRMVMIDSPWGSVTMHAFTGINIMAPNGNIKIMGKNVDITAGNKLTLRSGVNVKPFFTTSFEDENDPNSFKSQIKDVFSGILKKYSPVDMTFIRTLWEVLLKPVDGTLLINSSHYILMETGKGKAKIPNRQWIVKRGNILSHGMNSGKNMASQILEIKKLDIKLNAFVTFINQIFKERVHAINVMNKNALRYVNIWKKLEASFPNKEKLDKIGKKAVFEDFCKTQSTSKDHLVEVSDINNLIETYTLYIPPVILSKNKKTNKKRIGTRNLLCRTIKMDLQDLRVQAHDINSLINDTLVNLNNLDKWIAKNKPTSIEQITQDQTNSIRKLIEKKKFNINFANANHRIVGRTYYYETIMNFLIENKGKIELPAKKTVKNPKDWQNWVGKIKGLNTISKESSSLFLEKAYGWEGIKEERVWYNTAPGAVLFSNAEGVTSELKENGIVVNKDDYLTNLITTLNTCDGQI